MKWSKDDLIKLYIACAIKNTLITAIFAGLAVYFNKWGLVLLSILFWSSVKDGD